MKIQLIVITLLSTLLFASFVNPVLSEFARNYTFSLRKVSVPQHSVIGKIQDPRFISGRSLEIYNEIREIEFWNNLNFEEYNVENAPEAPFRRLSLGEIRELGEMRYQVQIELEGFRNTYILDTIFLYNNGDLNFLVLRSLR